MITKSILIMRRKIIFIIIVSLLFWGCSERYIKSEPICDSRFYVEVYTEWSDMGVCYLTDSTNFRIKADRFNIESEYHNYQCKSDSLIIEKWSKDETTPKHILAIEKYAIKKLVEEGTLGK
jgi:hypothetical protein